MVARLSTLSVDMDEIQNVRVLLKQRFPEIITGYLEDAERYLEGIHEGLREGDADKVAKHAHPLKSSSEGLGVLCMQGLAMEMERLAMDGAPTEQLQAKAHSLDVAFENVVPILQDLASV